MLAAPFYSTFARTNPGTLAYECKGFGSPQHDGATEATGRASAPSPSG